MKINSSHPSGSQIRPVKMLEAFKSLGCEVDVVMGTGKDRRQQIKQIKQKIKEGKRYDFVYSESSTYPTMFAYGVKDAFMYPLLDFSFFSFCKKNSIPIGLFYRDIYWKFPKMINKPFIKKLFLNIMHRFDLLVYQKYIDVLYLPSKKMGEYLNFNFEPIKLLPPGAVDDYFAEPMKTNNNLNIFYVGGIGGHYKMHKLLKVVGDFPNVSLTICCREKDWQLNGDSYNQLLKSNLNVVHVNGNDLIPFYEKADLVSLFWENSEYMDFAMPVKLFEYLAHKKPIIATAGTEAGNFVKDNGAGWVIPYDENALKELLNQIKENPEILIEKINNIYNILPMNTWKSRALQVCKDLSS